MTTLIPSLNSKISEYCKTRFCSWASLRRNIFLKYFVNDLFTRILDLDFRYLDIVGKIEDQ